MKSNAILLWIKLHNHYYAQDKNISDYKYVSASNIIYREEETFMQAVNIHMGA